MIGHIMKLKPRPTPLGTRIKSLRLAQGLSQYDLAVQSAISPTTIHKVESGKTQSPGIETLQQLARGLNVSLDELTGPPVVLGNQEAVSWQEKAMREFAPNTPPQLARLLLSMFDQMDSSARRFTLASIQGQLDARHGHNGQVPGPEDTTDDGDEGGRDDDVREEC